MENQIVFGTYNVPSLATSLTASYVVPGIMPKDEAKRISFAQQQPSTEPFSAFDQTLKNIFKVPKP
jgi:hypothetical protein